MNARAKHTHRTRDEEEEKKNCIAFNLNYEMMSFLSESFTNAFAQYISYGTCSIGYGKRRIQWRKLRLVVKAKKIKISMKEKQKYKNRISMVGPSPPLFIYYSNRRFEIDDRHKLTVWIASNYRIWLLKYFLHQTVPLWNILQFVFLTSFHMKIE